MARLATRAALIFFLLVLIAHASAYRKITIEIDESNPSREKESQSEKCREEFQKKDLSHCEDYITQSRTSSVLALRVVNQQQEHLDQCCPQIKQVDEPCQCDVINRVVQEQQEKAEQTEGKDAQQMLQRARNIPVYCHLSQHCDIQAVWF